MTRQACKKRDCSYEKRCADCKAFDARVLDIWFRRRK